MNRDYTIQIKINDQAYEKWKNFLKAHGTKLYGQITRLNTVALEEGINSFMKNPELFALKTKEVDHGN